MISYHKAKEILLKQDLLTVKDLEVSKALGMSSASNVTAQKAIPAFNNSAMDGFAVRSVDTLDAPIKLLVDGSSVAGDSPKGGSKNKGAWEIMTGAPIPTLYDAVIAIENIDILKKDQQGQVKEILVKSPAYPNQNLRKIAEDFAINDIVIGAGEAIRPEHIMALISLDIEKIKVYSKPKISVISTGKEIVDDFSKKLQPGQIRNSNAYYIVSALLSCNIQADYAGTIYDEVDVFEKTIQKILASDVNIIISTGAVSMGKHDFIPSSLAKLGAEILFHKASIRPGKPILFAKFPNGTLYFGLPGNPISSAVGLKFFVKPLINKIQGLAQEKPLFAKIISEPESKAKAGLRLFQKAYLHTDDQGQSYVKILQGQESFKMQSMLKANCWAVIPEEMSEITSQQIIETFPLNL